MTNSDKRIMDIVNQQAESKTLWVTSMTSVEAHLQKELRRLHAFLEFEIEEKEDKPILKAGDCGADLDRRIEFIENEIAKGGKGYEPALVLFTNIREYVDKAQRLYEQVAGDEIEAALKDSPT